MDPICVPSQQSCGRSIGWLDSFGRLDRWMRPMNLIMLSSSRNGMNCQSTLIMRLPWSPLPHALSTFSLPPSLPHLSVQGLFTAAQVVPARNY
ncbi:hypothetical protein T05_9807 [Trichinella murrelli]|uniref:Uncharacterized protein n=1 Tax=Trichinella murrelli TaxID=144512 RepID=A0A0V0UF07_9BILA|nr:hypothetical protein T05_9807 [Trichinella murrelli]